MYQTDTELDEAKSRKGHMAARYILYTYIYLFKHNIIHLIYNNIIELIHIQT